jgi:hypothetical protein
MNVRALRGWEIPQGYSMETLLHPFMTIAFLYIATSPDSFIAMEDGNAS